MTKGYPVFSNATSRSIVVITFHTDRGLLFMMHNLAFYSMDGNYTIHFLSFSFNLGTEMRTASSTIS
jgi:hypothetical protein